MDIQLPQLRGLLDGLPVGVAILRGADHVVAYSNPAMDALTGMRDAIGRPLSAAWPWAVAQGLIARIDEVYTTGRPLLRRDVPVEMPRAGGASLIRYLGFQWQPWLGAPEGLDGIAMLAWETTSAAPASRDASPDSRASLFDMLDVVVYELRTHPKRITYVSAAAERLLGYDRAEWERPDFWLRVLHPDDGPKALTARRQAIADVRDHELEYRVIHRDGGTYWVRDRAQVRRTPGEDGVTLRGVIVDVTALRAQEQDTRVQTRARHEERRQASLVELARGVAEDFDNLATEVHSCASVLELELDGGHPSQVMVHRLLRAVEHARVRIEGLRAFSGAETGASSMELSSLIRELAPTLGSAHRHRGTVRTRLAPGLPTIDIDPERIEHLLEGLIRTGLRGSSRAGRTVTVSTDAIDVEGAASDRDWHASTPPPAPGRYVRLTVAHEHPVGERDPSDLDEFLHGGRGLSISSAVSIARDVGGAVRVDQDTAGSTSVEVLFPMTSPAD